MVSEISFDFISNWRVLSLNFVILINLKFYSLLFSFYKNVRSRNHLMKSAFQQIGLLIIKLIILFDGSFLNLFQLLNKYNINHMKN